MNETIFSLSSRYYLLLVVHVYHISSFSTFLHFCLVLVRRSREIITPVQKEFVRELGFFSSSLVTCRILRVIEMILR
jgi:hypothetical protein